MKAVRQEYSREDKHQLEILLVFMFLDSRALRILEPSNRGSIGVFPTNATSPSPTSQDLSQAIARDCKTRLKHRL